MPRQDGVRPGDRIRSTHPGRLRPNPQIDVLGPMVILDAVLAVLRPPVESAQYLSIRYTERLAEAGAVCSVGSRGDSYDKRTGRGGERALQGRGHPHTQGDSVQIV